jgi:hypothetical protein
MKKRKSPHELLHPDLKPTTNHRYVGLEIECYAPISQDDLAALFFESDVAQYVALGRDGSISWDDDPEAIHAEEEIEDHEVRVCCRQSEVHIIIPKVVRILKAAGAKVNDTCGLHVHLDMRGRRAEKAYHNLYNMQEVLYRMVPADRKVGDYCRPHATTNDTLQNAVVNTHYSRYYGINVDALRRHGTLEVRIHHGTLTAKGIVDWVNLLVAVATGPLIRHYVGNISELGAAVKLPPQLFRYVCRQIGRYQAGHLFSGLGEVA